LTIEFDKNPNQQVYTFLHLDNHFRVVDKTRVSFNVAYNRSEEGDEIAHLLVVDILKRNFTIYVNIFSKY